jgi:RNA-directed DNA polymerase
VLSTISRTYTPSEGLPPELETRSNFMSYIDVSERELAYIFRFRHRMYRTFNISTKNKKERVIFAPDDRLAHLQRKVSRALKKIYRVRNPVHGFVRQKSIKTNALTHLRRKYLLNIDIEEFFPNISENRIVGLLISLGIDDDISWIIGKIVSFNESLPQGAPSSPIISNMICFRLDREIMEFAKESRFLFTRYADDITFSSHHPMNSAFAGAPPLAGYFDPNLLSERLKSIFDSNGFVINSSKAHYADKFSRKIVTGLKVNEKINVNRTYIRNIRAALFSVDSLGLRAAQKKFEEKHGGKAKLASHLQGKITWLGHIKGPSDSTFRSLAIKFNKLFSPQEIKYSPSVEEVTERSIWIVNNNEDCEQGTGFFVQGVGFVTAAHCVKSSSQISLEHPSKPKVEFKAEVKFIDKHCDLAILDHHVPRSEYLELDLLRGSPYKGEEVIAAGYPSFGPGDTLTIREGKILMLTPKHGLKLIEVSQKLPGGMSGGPILTRGRQVAGVIHKGGVDEERDFAIDVSVLHSVIASLPRNDS